MSSSLVCCGTGSRFFFSVSVCVALLKVQTPPSARLVLVLVLDQIQMSLY